MDGYLISRGQKRHRDEESRTLPEYPPRDDPEGFALHHWRLFTGYTTAAVCGADRYNPPVKIYREWVPDFDEAVETAKKRERIHIPAIAAGHYWEEAICCVAARHLYKSLFLTRVLCVRKAGPVQSQTHPRSRATADSFLCRANGSLIWPPVVIEAKFSTVKFPGRPSVEHLFQLHHQMHTFRIKSIFIAYGHCIGATKESDFKDGSAFVERVFHVSFSDELWEWIVNQREAFWRAFTSHEEPNASNGVPNLAHQFERKWVYGDATNTDAIPDEPTWRLVVETPPYTREMLNALPARLPAMPTLPDPVVPV